jgi:transposase
MRGAQPRGPRQARHETIEHGRRLRHPAGPGARPGEPARLPAAGPHALDKLDDLGPLPDDIRVHLDAGYDSQKTRDELAARGMTGGIARKCDEAPIRAGQRWHVERTSAWHNGFSRLQRCYERNEAVIDAYFDLADTIITVRSLVRQGWATRRWDTRPQHRR